MLIPRTYKSRLVIYMGLLLVFLVSVLLVAYHSSRSIIMEQANSNVTRVAQQIQNQLEFQANALRQRAQMIRNSVELTEYLYIVVNLGTEPAPLQDLFNRKFGWLPINHAVIIDKKNKVILGAEHAGLVAHLRSRNANQRPVTESFYASHPQGVELVATAPVYYQNIFLGNVSISVVLDNHWLIETSSNTSGDLFFVLDQKVLASTVSVAPGEINVTIPEQGVRVGDEWFVVMPVVLKNAMTNVPQMWYGVSETSLLRQLEHARDLIFVVVVLGVIAILLIGFAILRNFSEPLRQLLITAKDVGAGRFPSLPVSSARDEISELTRHFSQMVQNLKDKQDEINRIHEQLERQATTDDLTGLYNRRYLYDLFPKLLSEADRKNSDLVVILADLDHFKVLNDEYGHLAGDACLRSFSNIVKDCCRASDFVFRLGGEEFLILTIGTLEGGRVLAEKVRHTLEQQPIVFEGNTINMTVSIGMGAARLGSVINPLSAILAEVDAALYEAKDQGRNRISVARAA